jgi:hypothetical protein
MPAPCIANTVALHNFALPMADGRVGTIDSLQRAPNRNVSLKYHDDAY